MTLDYNKINPDDYDKRNVLVPREAYLSHHWYNLIQQSIEHLCEDKTVLEIGCGTGKYSKVSGKQANLFFGIDISKRMIIYAKNAYPNLNFGIADVNYPPIQKNSCDVIVCIGILEFIDRSILFKQLNDILKVNGYCIIQSSNRFRLMRLIPLLMYRILNKNYLEYPYLEPSRNEIRKKIKENNFVLIKERMDDGLIWLPDCVDKFCGFRIYCFIESIIKLIGSNPFSNGMLFIIKKKELGIDNEKITLNQKFK